MKPLINILIRTTEGRYSQMLDALKSIDMQTYNNVKTIICFDYDVNFNVDLIANCYSIQPNFSLGPFFYNDYCNFLKSKVDDGWFFFLDDDDCLANETVLEKLVQYIEHDTEAIVMQMSRSNGRIKPSNELIAGKEVISGKIGMPCLLLKAEHKNIADIQPTENGDFLWIKEVTEKVNTKFINHVVVHSPQRNFGK